MGGSACCKVGIVGITGYAGGELLRILLGHPHVDVCWTAAADSIGVRLDALYPHLRGGTDLVVEAPDLAAMRRCAIVFFATPHGVAMRYAADLLDAGVRVIDISADFRFKDVALWERWYDMPHACPGLVARAVYGLPEVSRDALVDADLVACAGCYPTAIQLGLLPLVEAGVIALDSIIADAKSGVSGAGKQPKPLLLMAERADNFCAYSVGGHRHQPEIEQGLSVAAGAPVSMTFVPHLAPMARGIEATLYATIKKEADFERLFQDRYRSEPFVDVMDSGQTPDTKSVRGVNMCRLSVYRPQGGSRLVVLSVIDNLVKGAAGQAVQCMNIACRWPETTGLLAFSAAP